MEEFAVILIVALVFGSILTGLYIISSLLGKMFGSRGGSRLSDEESQVMQEIFCGLKKMEERIESLETILLERDHRSRES